MKRLDKAVDMDMVMAHVEEGVPVTAFRHVAVFGRDELFRIAVERHAIGPLWTDGPDGKERPWVEDVYSRIAVRSTMDGVSGILEAISTALDKNGREPKINVSVSRKDDGDVVVVVVVGSL